MPVQPSYPGVYIEEIESGSHAIIGVDTSITAFIGRTVLGDLQEPTPCFSFGDFESLFGGRSHDYPLSYAVEDFFQNGGSKALIVRLESSATTTKASSLTVGDLVLSATSGGIWGNSITVKVDPNGITQAVADRFGLAITDLFNLTVVYTKPNKQKVTETFPNLCCKNLPNRVDRVLRQQSALLDAAPPPPAAGAAPAPAKTEFDPAAFLALAAATPLTGGNDSGPLADTDYLGDPASHTGLYALEKSDLFNLMCIPWDQRGVDVDTTVHGKAATFCAQRRAMYIVDPPADWTRNIKLGQIALIQPTDLGINDEAGQRHSAVYFPKVLKPDIEMGGLVDVFPVCGIVAGQIASTDLNRGVWKAPAGIATGMSGITGLEVNMTDAQNGLLNPIGINCLRNFRVLGPIIWGTRTLRGADMMSDDYKYIPVRRLTSYIEESLYRGTKFAVFEPNSETLWSQLRLSVGSFMADLSRQGAFYGYSVSCDKTTTTQSDIDRGVVNVRVAFAPVKPAEFVVLQIQQLAGQTAS